MKYLLVFLALSFASVTFSRNLASVQVQDSTSVLGSWQMDSTYFHHGDTRNGSASIGKNVWVFKDNGVLEVHMEGLDPFVGEYSLEDDLLVIILFGSKDPYRVTRLTASNLAILLDPSSSKKMISESVFSRVED